MISKLGQMPKIFQNGGDDKPSKSLSAYSPIFADLFRFYSTHRNSISRSLRVAAASPLPRVSLPASLRVESDVRTASDRRTAHSIEHTWACNVPSTQPSAYVRSRCTRVRARPASSALQLGNL